MVDMADIQALADRIAREFQPRRIILFGSHAAGSAGPDSDVDLLIVADYEGYGWRHASAIQRRFRPRPFALDLLVRTEQELQHRLEIGDFFFRDIVRDGVVLYEAPHR